MISATLIQIAPDRVYWNTENDKIVGRAVHGGAATIDQMKCRCGLYGFAYDGLVRQGIVFLFEAKQVNYVGLQALLDFWRRAYFESQVQ